MGHLSLYRKYRPASFAEVVGQEHVTRTLRNAISEDRIAHAYLFSGPRGTGKTSTARILAKCLNCERGPTSEPCGACESCVEIAEGNSLDVVEIDAASHGSVEDARDLREKVAYAPVAGRRKVYIIDECHMLSAAANNALLKVLEEPPGQVVFVFATTETHKVLQTLIDRCQRYEFRALGPDDLRGRLNFVSASEGISIDEEAAAAIGLRAAGSMRDALGLLEQLASFAPDGITGGDVDKLLGAVPDDLVREAVEMISQRDAAAAFAFTDRLVHSGQDVREFIRALIDHFRSLFLIQQAPSAQEILQLSNLQLERLGSQASRFETGELLRLLDLAGETHLEMRQAVDGRIALEVALVRMVRPDLHATPASMMTRIERLERLAGIEPRPTTMPPAQVPATDGGSSMTSRPQRVASQAAPPRDPHEQADGTPAGLDVEKVREAWAVILDKVKQRKVSARAMLLPADPVAWSAGELVLEFDPRSRFHRDQMSDPAYQAPLVEAFLDTLGIRPKLRCVLREEDGRSGSPAASDVAVAEQVEEEPASAPAATAGDKQAIDLIREGLAAEIIEEL